jgi:hypothetical protein
MLSATPNGMPSAKDTKARMCVKNYTHKLLMFFSGILCLSVFVAKLFLRHKFLLVPCLDDARHDNHF